MCCPSRSGTPWLGHHHHGGAVLLTTAVALVVLLSTFCASSAQYPTHAAAGDDADTTARMGTASTSSLDAAAATTARERVVVDDAWGPAHEAMYSGLLSPSTTHEGARRRGSHLPVQKIQLLGNSSGNGTMCYYPCILQHGCVCDGTQVHEVGGQNFGTCAYCSHGWGGWDCSVVLTTCLYGDLTHEGNASYCECFEGWHGSRCGEMECPHSINGTGPTSVSPVNPENNMCQSCKEGWGGENCNLCNSDDVCAGDGGSRCNSSLVPNGYEQHIQCEMSGFWVNVLGHNRTGVKGHMLVDWHKPSSWNSSDIADGLGRLSIWREEPGGIWLDPFFYCNLNNCTANLTTTTTPAVYEKVSLAYGILQHICSGFIFLTLIIMLLNGAVPVRHSKLQRKVMEIGITVLVLQLVFFVLFFSQWGHAVVKPAKEVNTVRYNCLDAACECAPDPKNSSWTYKCIGSFIGKNVLPIVKKDINFDCDYDTGECNLYSPTLLHGEKIPGMCKAGICVNDSLAPHQQTEDNTLPQVTPQQALTLIAGGMMLFAIVILAFHFFFDYQRNRMKKRRFMELYDDTLERQGEGSREPLLASNNTRPTAAYTSVSAVYEDGHHPPTDGVTLSLRNLAYHVADRDILRGISLQLSSGDTMAVMGPSGSGKTTMLDLVAMRVKEGISKGEVLFNNLNISNADSTGASFKNLVGYVAQEDTLIPALTVRQTVYYAARLKLPAPLSNLAINELVDDTLDRLYLRKCEHTQVGGSDRRGISGGEKRRVSIATELVANPRILILDEPTSGLDSVSAFEVVRAITGAARRTHIKSYRRYFRFRPIVIFSIHQPSESIYRMFDRVCLLQDGCMVYCGPAENALVRMHKAVESATKAMKSKKVPSPQVVVNTEEGDSRREEPRPSLRHFRVESSTPPKPSSHHFEEDDLTPRIFTNQAEALLMLSHTINDEDHLLRVAEVVRVEVENSADTTSDGVGGVPSSTAALHRMIADVVRFRPSVWQQLHVLASRSASALVGSYYLIAAHALFTVFLGITLSFLYRSEKLDLAGTENKAGLFTFLLLVVSFSSLSCLELFIAERRLFEVEHENGYYGTLPYFAVKVCFDFLPLRIIPTALLSATIYFPIGMRNDSGTYFLWFVEILTMFSLATTSLSLIIGIIAPAFGPAALFASLLVLWNTAFGGLMIQGETIPPFFRPFKYISPSWYAYESLMVNELLDQTVELNFLNKDGLKQKVKVPLPGITFLYNLGLDPDHFGRDVAILHGLVFGFVILAFFVLLMRVHMPRFRAFIHRKWIRESTQ